MLAKSPGFTIVAVLTLALASARTPRSSALSTPLSCDRSLTRIRLRSSTFGANSKRKAFRRTGSPSPNTGTYAIAMNRSRRLPPTHSAAARTSPRRCAACASFLQPPPRRACSRCSALRRFLGRSFSADEDQPGHSHFALLSYASLAKPVWPRPNIVTKSIQLDGETYYHVVGVSAARQFSLGGKQAPLDFRFGLNRANPASRLPLSSRP